MEPSAQADSAAGSRASIAFFASVGHQDEQEKGGRSSASRNLEASGRVPFLSWPSAFLDEGLEEAWETPDGEVVSPRDGAQWILPDRHEAIMGRARLLGSRLQRATLGHTCFLAVSPGAPAPAATNLGSRGKAYSILGLSFAAARNLPARKVVNSGRQ